jgi:hypothetical protein
MKRFLIFLAAFATLAFAEDHAHAQLTLSAASLFSANKSLPATCQKEEDVFLRIAKNYPLPAKWKVVIVCDEPSWKDLLRRMVTLERNHPPDAEKTYGETSIEANLTFLRGNALLYPDLGNTPEQTIAHELAHVMLHSRDEYRVDAQADAWMKQQRRNPGSLVAMETAPTDWSPSWHSTR